MCTSRRLLVLVAVGLVVQLAAPSRSAEAGPFLDWLLGRPIYTYPGPVATAPGTVAVPAVTNATAVPAATVAPVTITTGYAPATTATVLPSAASSTIAYSPVVPVTAYYPASAAPVPTSPSSAFPAVGSTGPGYPASSFAAPVVQPVIAGYVPNYRTTWFRVPVTQYRPVVAYQGVAAQPTTVVQPCNTYTWQAQRTPRLFSYRPWLPAPAAITPAVPVVVAPAVTAPAVTAPAVVAPTMTAPAFPSTTAPITSPPPATLSAPPAVESPMYGVPPTGGLEPADQPPSLQLNGSSGGMPHSAMSAPANGSTSEVGRRAAQTPASSIYQVKPIPVPELNDSPSIPRPSAPPLLNARERTASAQAASRSPAVTPAVWSQGQASQPARKPAPAAEPQQLWNDSGWRSAGSY